MVLFLLNLSFMKPIIKFICVVFILIISSCSDDFDDTIIVVEEQEDLVISEDVTVYDKDNFYNGYTLIAPINSTKSYLINMEGFVVKKWESDHRTVAATLTKEGELLRTYPVPNPVFSFGGRTGGLEKFDLEGNLIWSWEYSSPQYTLHHDIVALPNGNILASVWDLKDANEAIENGRDVDLLIDNAVWAERIIEIKPIGTNDAEIVWQWELWNHLIQDYDSNKANFGVIAENPEKINLNYTSGIANLSHMNSLFYIDEFDQIVFGSRRFNELMIIDHSTSTSEATTNIGGNYGKGGNLLYRWGNPEAYNSGLVSDKLLFGQHDITYIGNLPNHGGNFMCFNNSRSSTESSVDEIEIPMSANGSYTLLPFTNNQPTDYSWSYISSDIYAPRVSGAKRLANGNTLITQGTNGTLYEINEANTIVWQYTIPLEVNNVFKSYRYSVDLDFFQGETLPILGDGLIIE